MDFKNNVIYARSKLHWVGRCRWILQRSNLVTWCCLGGEGEGEEILCWNMFFFVWFRAVQLVDVIASQSVQYIHVEFITHRITYDRPTKTKRQAMLLGYHFVLQSVFLQEGCLPACLPACWSCLVPLLPGSSQSVSYSSLFPKSFFI